MSVRESDFDELASLWSGSGVTPPVEQTRMWARFQEKALGWTVWAVVVIEDGAGPLATAVITRVPWHGQHYLWARHAPVWLREHSAEQESALVEALRGLVERRGDRALHLTVDLDGEVPGTVQSSRFLTYDSTVQLDTRPLREGESVKVPAGASEREALAEVLISRMKARGRRDVRVGGRHAAETGVTYADEWERGASDFDEHHAIMAETASRDGFTPWGSEVYRTMLVELGREHAMLMSVRRGEELVGWCLITIMGERATYYYAASSSEGRQHCVIDRMVLEAAVEASLRGCATLDMMGIGSDRVPELRTLNQFKTKFSPEVVHTPHAREITLRPRMLALMEAAARLRGRLRR